MKKHLAALILPLIFLTGCQPATKPDQTTQDLISSQSGSVKDDDKSTATIPQTTSVTAAPPSKAAPESNQAASDPETSTQTAKKGQKSNPANSAPSAKTPSQAAAPATSQWHHVGDTIVTGFPSDALIKSQDLNISWSAPYALGYSVSWRAIGPTSGYSTMLGDLSKTDGDRLIHTTNLTIDASQLPDGTHLQITVYAAGYGGSKCDNITYWTGDLFVLNLAPPVITYPTNGASISKGDVNLSWSSTLDNKILGFEDRHTYNISVKDLTVSQTIYTQKLQEQSPKMYRNYTLPSSLFTSGHKYQVALEEIAGYQSYVSDQGPMIGTVVFNV